MSPLLAANRAAAIAHSPGQRCAQRVRGIQTCSARGWHRPACVVGRPTLSDVQLASIVSTERDAMTKYKLEYIWLDGYTPVAEPARQDADQGIRLVSRRSSSSRCGASTAARRMQAEGQQLRLRAEAGRGLSRRRAHQRRARHVRSHDAGRQDPARVQQARHHPRRRRRLVRLRAGILLLQGRPPARLPDGRLSGAAGPLLHRRRLQERRRRRARDRRGASRPLPRRRHQPRRHQRRGGEGPVGIPDFRQGLQEGRRRNVDGPLPVAAPDREVRHRHRVPLQAARRHRLERLGHARQLLDRVYARRSAARTTSRR